MNAFLRVFPIICFVFAAISVLADIRGVIEFLRWGVGDGMDLTRPIGFQVVMLTIRAVIQSLQWVAYGVLAELLLRHLRVVEALSGVPKQISTGSDNHA